MTNVEVPSMRAKVKCRARRHDGVPCKNWALTGGPVCRMHGGAAKQVKRKAAARIEASLDRAALAVVRLMESADTPHAVKLAAAKDLMDRGGLTAATALTMSQGDAPWQVILQKTVIVLDDEEGSEPLTPTPSDEMDDSITDAEIVDDADPLRVRVG